MTAGDLVGLAVDVALSQHDCGVAGQSGQQVPPAAVGASGAAKGDAVQGDDLHLFGVDVVQRGSGTQDDVEPVGVEALQSAPDRGFRGTSPRILSPSESSVDNRIPACHER